MHSCRRQSSTLDEVRHVGVDFSRRHFLYGGEFIIHLGVKPWVHFSNLHRSKCRSVPYNETPPFQHCSPWNISLFCGHVCHEALLPHNQDFTGLPARLTSRPPSSAPSRVDLVGFQHQLRERGISASPIPPPFVIASARLSFVGAFTTSMSFFLTLSCNHS